MMPAKGEEILFRTCDLQPDGLPSAFSLQTFALPFAFCIDKNSLLH